VPRAVARGKEKGSHQEKRRYGVTPAALRGFLHWAENEEPLIKPMRAGLTSGSY